MSTPIDAEIIAKEREAMEVLDKERLKAELAQQNLTIAEDDDSDVLTPWQALQQCFLISYGYMFGAGCAALTLAYPAYLLLRYGLHVIG